MYSMLEQIRIVLVSPSHPGNIGATARAMKNMGLSSLYLVKPRCFPHQEATVRAAGADDVLANAVLVDCLEAAVAGCRLVFGASARSRSLPWPSCTPRECAQKSLQTSHQPAAIVFGRESSGLSNEELAVCQFHVHIPTVTHFRSLNLAAAVQVLTYELFVASTKWSADHQQCQSDATLATSDEVLGFLKQFESVLLKIGFLDPQHPKLLLQRLYRLFNRARLEEKEIHILRGILSTLELRLKSGITDVLKHNGATD